LVFERAGLEADTNISAWLMLAAITCSYPLMLRAKSARRGIDAFMTPCSRSIGWNTTHYRLRRQRRVVADHRADDPREP